MLFLTLSQPPPPPPSSRLPLLPVDSPNKATCVVSGCLEKGRPVSRPGRPCLPRDRLHAFLLLCLVFFSDSFTLSFPQSYHSLHPCHASSFSLSPSDITLPLCYLYIFCFFFAFLLFTFFLISFFFTLSADSTSSVFTHSPNYWLHTNLNIQNSSQVIHKTLLGSKWHKHET